MSVMVWDQALDSLRQLAHFLWPFEFADTAVRAQTRHRKRLNRHYLRMVSLQRRLEKLRTLLEKEDQICRVQTLLLEGLQSTASLNLEKCLARRNRLLARIQRGEQNYLGLQQRFRRLKEIGSYGVA